MNYAKKYDLTAICAYYQAGNSLRVTGKRFGLSHGVIRRILLSNGVQPRTRLWHVKKKEHGYGGSAESCSCEICAAYRRGAAAGRAGVRRKYELAAYDDTYGGLLP